ncbi:MAG: diacylglycerol/lipid kinase family protein [Pleomorphochaeta sp.]|jgi:YegS/Rv2252/BmrU family lipid kinase
MEERGLVILNPNANKGKASKLEKNIFEAFNKENLDVDLVKSKGIEDCRNLAYQAVEKYSFICAVGGDGTVNEVADGLLKRAEELSLPVEKRPLFSIIPIGRGNDFAWMLKINKKDISEIVKKIKERKGKLIDVGFCIGGIYPKGSHFVNGLGIGFEPSVNFIASSFKKVSGTLSYVLALIKMLRHYPTPMNLTIEKESGTFDIESQQLSLGNGKRMGGAFLMTPKAIIDDGFLDFVYANKPIEKKIILKTAVKFLSGKQIDDSHFSFSREKWVNIIAKNKDMPIHIDGEMVGKNVEKIQVYIKSKVLNVIY